MVGGSRKLQPGAICQKNDADSLVAPEGGRNVEGLRRFQQEGVLTTLRWFPGHALGLRPRRSDVRIALAGESDIYSVQIHSPLMLWLSFQPYGVDASE